MSKGVKGFLKGENHPNWKGDEVGYFSKHNWLIRHYIKSGKCEKCGTTKARRTEWANLSGKYLRDIKDYLELCPSCHRLIDRGNKCRNGHDFTKDNVWIRKKKDIYGVVRKVRVCRECQRGFIKTYQLKKRIKI